MNKFGFKEDDLSWAVESGLEEAAPVRETHGNRLK